DGELPVEGQHVERDVEAAVLVHPGGAGADPEALAPGLPLANGEDIEAGALGESGDGGGGVGGHAVAAFLEGVVERAAPRCPHPEGGSEGCPQPEAPRRPEARERAKRRGGSDSRASWLARPTPRVSLWPPESARRSPLPLMGCL